MKPPAGDIPSPQAVLSGKIEKGIEIMPVLGYTICAEIEYRPIEKQLGGISHGYHYKRYHHWRHPGHGAPDRADFPVHRYALPGLPLLPGRDCGGSLHGSRH